MIDMNVISSEIQRTLMSIEEDEMPGLFTCGLAGCFSEGSGRNRT